MNVLLVHLFVPVLLKSTQTLQQSQIDLVKLYIEKRIRKKKFKKRKSKNLHPSSLSRSSAGDDVRLAGIGLTGALTIGLLGFVIFCVVGLFIVVAVVVAVAVAIVGFVVFLSGRDSVTLVRGTVDFIGGFTVRFSILMKYVHLINKKRKENMNFTEHFLL